MDPDLDFVTRPTVLIVDDTPDNLSLMSGLLKVDIIYSERQLN